MTESTPSNSGHDGSGSEEPQVDPDAAPYEEAQKTNALYISNRDGTVIDQAIVSLLPNLTLLDATNNFIVLVSESVTRLTRLESLFLKNNSLKTNNAPGVAAVENIFSIESLTELDLSFNDIGTLPTAVSTTRLVKLNMGNNDLRLCKLPAFSNLNTLYLHNNRNLGSAALGVCVHTNLTDLDLSNCGIKSLPTEVKSLGKLKKLNLSNNDLMEFPDSLLHFKKLITLSLARNDILSIPADITKLNSLEHLDIRGNMLTKLPREINNMGALKVLHAQNNEITALPLMKDMTSLEEIDVSFNSIDTLDTVVMDLRGTCRRINLSANEVGIVPVDLKKEVKEWIIGEAEEQLGNEEPTEYYRGAREEFDDTASESTDGDTPRTEKSMSQVMVRRSSIASVELCDMVLEWLSVDSNDIAYVPRRIFDVFSLTFLSLRDNKMRTLPADIEKLSNLEVLNLQNNLLTDLPPEIGRLKQLRVLSLSHNKFIEFPRSIWGATSIQILSADNNELQGRIPRGLYYMRELRYLNLSRNHINGLPKEFSSLKNLAEVNMSHNNLVRLPEEVGKLPRLVRLNLRSNLLKRLPVRLAECKNLIHLDVSYNELQAFDGNIYQMPHLVQLYLHPNPFSLHEDDGDILDGEAMKEWKERQIEKRRSQRRRSSESVH